MNARRERERERTFSAGAGFARAWTADVQGATDSSLERSESSELERLFDDWTTGRGIHKWRHYFEIYERHLGRFVGSDVHFLEIGVQSGGSLELWRRWLGRRATLYGVDIDSACVRSEAEGTFVFIGDQEDRTFWSEFRSRAPRLDVVIDDGGHTPEQQRVTLEELLPHLSPGGVYICEDVHSDSNPFVTYIQGLSQMLFAGRLSDSPDDPERAFFATPVPFQVSVHAVHHYPYVVVIEKRIEPVPEFVAPRHGDDWLG
jgi:hypothetical protein